MLAGKKIILGITGSIAAYKSPLLVRQLIKAGAEVRVLITPAGIDFVSPLTLSTLSRYPVLSDMFNAQSWANHVELGRWADLMLMAPLSCNTLSKMASGQCDNLLLAVYLSATCPVMVAPAMDEDMWHHPTTRKNLEILANNGNLVLEVGHGELASGLIGEGRMLEPEQLMNLINEFFRTNAQLKGKKALVTAGPTYEAIDPVRFIGNHSSGKMGFAIAEELAGRGAEVTLVSGPVAIKPKNNRIKLVPVTTADEMHTTCTTDSATYDIAVMAAAVADYSPKSRAEQKIKKSGDELTITLHRTKDILGSLGKTKRENQVLVGFALETENEIQNARKKLVEKNADLIVLNSLNDEGAGFGFDTNMATFLFRAGTERKVELKSKSSLARDIVDSIIEIS